jgi:hypothetical protein
VLGQDPRELSGLLCDPLTARLGRASREMHTTTAQLDQEEHVESLEPDRLDGEEIYREHAASVRSQEFAPRPARALAGREACGPEILRPTSGCNQRPIRVSRVKRSVPQAVSTRNGLCRLQNISKTGGE